MLQILQYQKNGEISVEDIPAPVCPDEGILVRTCFSLISAGTERTSVENTKASLLQRARKQPEQVRQVIDVLKKDGLISTIKKVQSKLDSYKSLGYSASGIVIESRTDKFSPGDRVACAGAGLANHSEIIGIPRNLAVKIPEKVSFEEAAYTTLGTIALQGVRQANVSLGENVAVIGLGLLGQLTVQLLKASGCKVTGLDINATLFDKAIQYGCNNCFLSNKENTGTIRSSTGTEGFDAVIITASSGSSEPMDIALEISRKKGRIVVVGGVPMNIPRSPFYEKELELTISCSYGPGRYDPEYEILGIDYPFHYVRWTENRNMESFLDLVAEGKIDVNSITTHIFEINDALRAYNIITGKEKADFLGILIKYPEHDNISQKKLYQQEKNYTNEKVKIGFIGAGQFGQSYLIPNMNIPGVELVGVSSLSGVDAHTVARQFNFGIATTDAGELIRQPDINLIFIATQHDSHGKYVLDSIRSGKSVYVEKPLAVNRDELYLISDAVEKHSGRVMVGYNRRFSQSFRLIKEFLTPRTEQMIINYRVNAGKLPRNHWVYRQEQGSGRIVGEVCHFIDCMVFLTGSLPVKIYSEVISSDNTEVFNNDNVLITIKFRDGSTGAIEYLANGNSLLPKERCEVFCEGKTAVMDNFTIIELYSGKNIKVHKLDGKKGHREEVIATINSISNGTGMPIPFRELEAISTATFAALESITTGNAVLL